MYSTKNRKLKKKSKAAPRKKFYICAGIIEISFCIMITALSLRNMLNLSRETEDIIFWGCAFVSMACLPFTSIYDCELNLPETDDPEKMLRNGTYFTRDVWQRKYGEFRKRHQVRRIFLQSMTMDLSYRFILKRLAIDYLAFLYLIPFLSLLLSFGIIYFAPSGMSTISIFLILLATGVSCEFLYLTTVFLFSRSIFPKWLAEHPEYRNRASDIRLSYSNGKAFISGYSCVIIGDKYLHAFDGRSFYTVLRKEIQRTGWHIVRKVVRRGRYDDKYLFNIHFSSAGQKRHEDFKITLDQFQIKMIMDVLFPGTSDDNEVIMEVNYCSRHELRLFGDNSQPVMDDE